MAGHKGIKKHQKTWALYKGETLLADGNMAEISEQTGKKVYYLKFMTCPSYKARTKPDGNNLQMVCLDD